MHEVRERWQYVDLPKGGRRSTMGGSKPPKRKRAVSPKKTKKLTKKDRATPEGRFATHFEELLAERHWTRGDFCLHSGIADATVRKWLRADGMPNTVEWLEAIAEGFDTPEHPMKDYRLVLPPPKK